MKSISTFLAVFCAIIVFSQQHPFCSTECGGTPDCERDFENFDECNVAGPFSAAFHLRHKHVTNFRPYPNSNIAFKTVRVNIIVITEPGEPMPFEFNETLLEYMNETFVGSEQPPFCNEPNNNCPCPTPVNPDYIEDSRIRVEVVNVRHIENTQYTYYVPLQNRLNWHLSNYPEDADQLNWFFVKQHKEDFDGLSSAVHGGIGVNISHMVSTYKEPNEPQNFVFDEVREITFFRKHFPHELGHLLNLEHPDNMRSFVLNNPIDNAGFYTAPYEFFDVMYRGTNTNDIGDGGDRFGGCGNIMAPDMNYWISPKQMG